MAKKTSKKAPVKKSLPPLIPCAIVEWLDAHWDSDEVPLKKLRKGCKPWPMSTVGFIVQDDAEGIMLVHEVNEKRRTGHGSTFIPRGMVKKVRPLRADRCR